MARYSNPENTHFDHDGLNIPVGHRLHKELGPDFVIDPYVPDEDPDVQIIDNMTVVERRITPRRLREAILTPHKIVDEASGLTAIKWLENHDNLINQERKKLKKNKRKGK